MSERAPDRPGRALERHGDLAGGRGAADGAEPLDRRVAGPADHAGAGAGGEQVLVEIVRQQVDGLVDAVAQHAKPERDRPALAAARDQAPEGGRAIGGQRLPGEVGDGRQAPHVALDGGVGAEEPRGQHPVGLGGERGREQLEGRRHQLGRHDVARGGGERVARAAGDEGDVGAGQGPEPEMGLRDDAEPAEPADLQLGEVVPGDVLDDSAAGLDQPAVAGGDGAAEHVVAHRAEPVAERDRRWRWR